MTLHVDALSRNFAHVEKSPLQTVFKRNRFQRARNELNPSLLSLSPSPPPLFLSPPPLLPPRDSFNKR